MRAIWFAPVLSLCVAGCGSDGIGNDPGDGSQTLLVHGNFEYDAEDGSADFRVSITRAGNDVTNAAVTVESELGEVVLVHDGNNEYRGVQAGWADGYRLTISAGPDDNLTGAIDAPGVAVLITPDPQTPFDPHLAEGGVVQVRWQGEPAMTARVRTKDFEWGPYADEGEVLVPAMFFSEDQQDLDIDRTNSISLEGGAPGSDLSAQIRLRHRITLLNPF